MTINITIQYTALAVGVGLCIIKIYNFIKSTLKKYDFLIEKKNKKFKFEVKKLS